MTTTGKAALDANAYVAIQSGDVDALTVIKSFNGRCLPTVVLGELLYGAGASGRPAQNRQLVDDFAATCLLLDVNAAVAARYAELRLRLRRSGRPIPANDIWIAAACLEAAVPLITRDGHFAHVPDLQIISW